MVIMVTSILDSFCTGTIFVRDLLILWSTINADNVKVIISMQKLPRDYINLTYELYPTLQ